MNKHRHQGREKVEGGTDLTVKKIKTNSEENQNTIEVLVICARTYTPF